MRTHSHEDRPASSPSAAPVHPGNYLAGMLQGLDANVSQAARDLGMSRQALHRVIGARAPVTPDLAVRLERYTGCTAEVWLMLQMGFDLKRARRTTRLRRR